MLLDSIEGVVVASPPAVLYDNGVLTEFYRPDWANTSFWGREPIEHLYTVFSPSGETRKEWYFHEHTIDRYSVISGALAVGLYDARRESSTFAGFEVVTLEAPGSDSPTSLRIPAGVWHSLSWKTPSGMFLNCKSPPFNPGTVDKFRVPIDELPPEIVWNV